MKDNKLFIQTNRKQYNTKQQQQQQQQHNNIITSSKNKRIDIRYTAREHDMT